MPAKDLNHDRLRNALVNDGWTITADPLYIPFGSRDMYIDLGADKLLTATKGEQKIAVELKSFVGSSTVHDMHLAIGQFFVYLMALKRKDPERVLFLAVNEEIYDDVFEEELGRALLDEYKVPLIVFDSDKEVILKWIIWNTNAN